MHREGGGMTEERKKGLGRQRIWNGGEASPPSLKNPSSSFIFRNFSF